MAESTNAATATKKPLFKRMAEVTVAQLKIKPNTEYYAKFIGPIHLGQQLPDKITVDPKTGEVTKETPKRAHVAYIIDLETMKPSMVVVSSVMVSELERGYPKSGYVGLCFGFKSLGKIDGKGYNTIEIWQIEEPEGVPEARIAPGVLMGTESAASATDTAPVETVKEEVAASAGTEEKAAPASGGKKK